LTIKFAQGKPIGQHAFLTDFAFRLSESMKRSFKFSGGYIVGATPVPIPNTEVKPYGADGTARATAWESRSPPGLIQTKARLNKISGLFVFLSKTFSNKVLSVPL
jgi:hypothetical protein